LQAQRLELTHNNNDTVRGELVEPHSHFDKLSANGFIIFNQSSKRTHT